MDTASAYVVQVELLTMTGVFCTWEPKDQGDFQKDFLTQILAQVMTVTDVEARESHFQSYLEVANILTPYPK